MPQQLRPAKAAQLHQIMLLDPIAVSDQSSLQALCHGIMAPTSSAQLLVICGMRMVVHQVRTPRRRNQD